LLELIARSLHFSGYRYRTLTEETPHQQRTADLTTFQNDEGGMVSTRAAFAARLVLTGNVPLPCSACACLH
jgi:hypothetical protein